MIIDPSSPLKAIAAKAPLPAQVTFADGETIDARRARGERRQYRHRLRDGVGDRGGDDMKDLSLPREAGSS